MLADRSKPDALRLWFYDQDGDETVRAVFTARSTEWDPALRDEKSSKSISFDPGPAGGGLSCGYAAGPDDGRPAHRRRQLTVSASSSASGCGIDPLG
ncbi:hypothetical protein [Streptomyces sp. NPDC051183]|uniref:hypothetical protein n=1 Tax=unclassified Streptomyces TaxID=2593676 RepID=UPI0034338486